MDAGRALNVLSLNLGSSSLKYSVHAISARNAGERLSRDVEAHPDPASAAQAASAAIADAVSVCGAIDAVGHRFVFGGPDDAPARVTPAVIERLQSLQSLDPLHLPGELAVIEQSRRQLSDVPNVACFDTAFFHDMPQTAQALPIPVHDKLLRRYGFHGLSYESIVHRLGAGLPLKTIVAHLGNGASAAALLDGKPVESTMGFSPLSGLIMSTRPGDLDPGVVLYLLERDAMDAAALRDMLETRSGLTALSGGEPDVQKLCGRNDEAAKFAVEMFVRSVAKAIGSLATSLNGVDMLAFTGGIGEHNAAVREAITARVRFLNPAMDVCVLPSDENLAIALRAAQVVNTEREPGYGSLRS